MDQYRQGDVLLVRVDENEMPATATPVPRENGLVVLAHGEATGHHHSLKARGARLFEAAGQRFLRLSQPEALAHQEHDAIELPAGTYRVVRQREYSPEEIRTVAD
jgi:hypothetical protein